VPNSRYRAHTRFREFFRLLINLLFLSFWRGNYLADGREGQCQDAASYLLRVWYGNFAIRDMDGLIGGKRRGRGRGEGEARAREKEKKRKEKEKKRQFY